MELFGKELAKHGGVLRSPDGAAHPVSIPDDVKDGEGFYVNVAITRLKPSE
ncbi:MAG: hypothetical protein M3370_02350 [Actinomycetota bacterium]|nr:hypothetical protein [Actinomycetota bacterium]